MNQLENLNYWAMESNQFTGYLPTWVSQLENLEYLALGNNTFSGSLPSFDGSNLVELSLDTNELEGPIDSLNDAKLLETVYLNDNSFKGPFNISTWEDLDELVIVDLSNNELYGSFPSSFYWVEEIDLSNNNLDGIIDPPYDNDEGDTNDLPITRINLSGNDIKGTIPTQIDKLSSLISFDVSNNALTGNIPSQLGSLTLLESLYLSKNNFLTGTIPDLHKCDELTELSLAHTNRNGDLFSWIGASLENLVLLDLHDNKLDSSIPTDLAKLTDLEILLLNRNKLTGIVPTQLGELENLGAYELLCISFVFFVFCVLFHVVIVVHNKAKCSWLF
jgi:Leucine-rich repeat (LRR) protein